MVTNFEKAARLRWLKQTKGNCALATVELNFSLVGSLKTLWLLRQRKVPILQKTGCVTYQPYTC